MLNDEELQKLFDKILADKCKKTFKIALIEDNVLTIINIKGEEDKKSANGRGLLFNLNTYNKDDKGNYKFGSLDWSRWSRTLLAKAGRFSYGHSIWGFYNVDTRQYKSDLDNILQKLDNMLNNKDVIVTYDDWAK